ncbi:MAG: T9SS type A sorting domain-containing protein [Bacteroidia bacterium]
MKKIMFIALIAFVTNAKAQCTLTVTGNAYTICSGGSQTFSVSGASTYTWSPSATLDNPNIANPTASPTTTTVYSVTGTTGTCVATPVTVTVTVNATPTAPILINTSNPIIECQGQLPAITLSVTPAGGSVPVWYLNLGNTSIANGSDYTPPNNIIGTTIYSVYDSSTTGSGCVSYTSGGILTITVTVSSCGMGIEQFANSNEVSIYPNPATEMLNVELGIINENTTLQITDMLGSIHSTFIIQHSPFQISVADLSEGIYNLQISTSSNCQINKRLLIVR